MKNDLSPKRANHNSDKQDLEMYWSEDYAKVLDWGNPILELYGFDISDVLINKAIAKGIPSASLKVMDAANMDYTTNEFDYSYSIGSLEHFTIDGIDDFVSECSRYSKIASFHVVLVSRSGNDGGWIKTIQSYHNNSEGWWHSKFTKTFSAVRCISSKWEDHVFGKWYVFIK